MNSVLRYANDVTHFSDGLVIRENADMRIEKQWCYSADADITFLLGIVHPSKTFTITPCVLETVIYPDCLGAVVLGIFHGDMRKKSPDEMYDCENPIPIIHPSL